MTLTHLTHFRILLTSSLSQQIFACFVLFLCRIPLALNPVFFQALQFYKTRHEIYRCLNRILQQFFKFLQFVPLKDSKYN